MSAPFIVVVVVIVKVVVVVIVFRLFDLSHTNFIELPNIVRIYLGLTFG